MFTIIIFIERHMYTKFHLDFDLIFSVLHAHLCSHSNVWPEGAVLQQDAMRGHLLTCFERMYSTFNLHVVPF